MAMFNSYLKLPEGIVMHAYHLQLTLLDHAVQWVTTTSIHKVCYRSWVVYGCIMLLMDYMVKAHDLQSHG